MVLSTQRNRNFRLPAVDYQRLFGARAHDSRTVFWPKTTVGFFSFFFFTILITITVPGRLIFGRFYGTVFFSRQIRYFFYDNFTPIPNLYNIIISDTCLEHVYVHTNGRNYRLLQYRRILFPRHMTPWI